MKDIKGRTIYRYCSKNFCYEILIFRASGGCLFNVSLDACTQNFVSSKNLLFLYTRIVLIKIFISDYSNNEESYSVCKDNNNQTGDFGDYNDSNDNDEDEDDDGDDDDVGGRVGDGCIIKAQ